MDRSVRERAKAIVALDLGPEASPGTLKLAENASATVDGCSLISFTSNVSVEHRKDVLYSVLLSQLVANRKHNRQNDAKNWYAFYAATLEQVGWVVVEQTGFSHFFPPATRFTASSVITGLLEQIASDQEMLAVEGALNTLRQLDDQDATALLFERESHVGGIGNFQVAAVSELDGNVIMKIGRFYFRTNAIISRLLFADFPLDAEFFRGLQILQLNEEVYAPLRQDVIGKLNNRPDTLIQPLPDFAE
ncbi:hypothetical protein [Streptosporangium canum]|uniref:hypothetical protein n=1 Tax=Streptosporangium canum TaxID=324952 RepID=UPI003788DAA3